MKKRLRPFQDMFLVFIKLTLPALLLLLCILRPGVFGVHAETPAEHTHEAPVAVGMEEAVRSAFLHSGQVGAAAERVRGREASVGQARSLRMPQLSSSLLYSYVDQMRSPFPDGALVNRLFPVSDILPDRETFTAQLRVEQVLYAGGGIQAGIEAAEAMTEVERHRREETLARLEQEVRDAYVQLQHTEALVTVAEESVATFQRHLEDSRELLDAGVVTSFEVLRAETEVGARQTDLSSARTAASLARIQLCRLMGLPQDTALELLDDLAREPFETPLAYYLEQARAYRPELDALEAAEEAADAALRQVRAEYRPRAMARAQYQKIEGAGRVMPEGWSFQIGGEWSLYAGGRRKQETLEAESQRRALGHEQRDARELVEMDVRQAYLRCQESLDRIAQEERRVALAAEGLRLAHIRYEEGVSVQTEILDAALAHSQAKSAHVGALREYAEAHNALIRAAARDSLARQLALEAD